MSISEQCFINGGCKLLVSFNMYADANVVCGMDTNAL